MFASFGGKILPTGCPGHETCRTPGRIEPMRLRACRALAVLERVHVVDVDVVKAGFLSSLVGARLDFEHDRHTLGFRNSDFKAPVGVAHYSVEKIREAIF